MKETIKINKLELENVKRVKAVTIEPSRNGLTVIGGKNNQGKTSVIDCIAWALGGNKFKPSEPHREGSVLDPNLKVTLSNGLVVERKGKNSDLKVLDPTGNKAGQGLLDNFIEELALNLPKFIESTSKDKANSLLQIIGVGDQLTKYELEEKELYNERLVIGRTADQKEKFAKEQQYFPDAPKEPVSAKELIDQQQEILARNGENQKKRENVSRYEYQVTSLTEEIARISQQLKIKQDELNSAMTNLSIAKTDALELIDQSTEELENSINNIDEMNRKVRINLDKEKAEEDAKEYRSTYDKLSIQIDDVRKKKMDLLKGANMPLEGLSVEDGELTYEGYKWDNMSGSQQLRVATAIVRELKPECGFVLLDKLEQMDIDTMNDFGKWLEEQGLQAIATRVSTGGECSIIIEDGYVKGDETIVMQGSKEITGNDFIPKHFEEKETDSLNGQEEIKEWKAGEF